MLAKGWRRFINYINKLRKKMKKSNTSYQVLANKNKERVEFQPIDLLWVHLSFFHLNTKASLCQELKDLLRSQKSKR